MDPANGVIEVGEHPDDSDPAEDVAATEAMYLMARHVFEDLGYRRYEWKCNAQQCAIAASGAAAMGSRLKESSGST